MDVQEGCIVKEENKKIITNIEKYLTTWFHLYCKQLFHFDSEIVLSSTVYGYSFPGYFGCSMLRFIQGII